MKSATMCSGVGAPELAAPGFDWIAACDIDPFPRSVFAERWPGVEMHGDLRAVAENPGRYLEAELIVAGTPCQAFSAAGKRQGVRDDRGQVTLAFVGVVHELATTGALRNVVWENVPGVLSDTGNAFGCFLGALVGIGYPLIPSPRPRNGVPGRYWRRISGRRWKDGRKWKRRRAKLAPCWPSVGMAAGPRARVAWRILDAQYFGVAQRRRRVFLVADFGGGADPAEVLFERRGGERNSTPRQAPRAATASALTASAGGADDNDAQGGRLVARTLKVGSGYRYDGDSETFVVNLRGRECGAMPEISDKASLRAASGGSSRSYVATVASTFGSAQGGGRAPQAKAPERPVMAFNARQDPIDSKISLPVDTDGTTIGVHAGSAVRRLTPTECERLQGMPDGHTLVMHQGKPASDAARYKAIGNSMAVPVLAWILDRLSDSMEKT